MSTHSAHLSVVIPFYNEVENVAPMFARLLPVLKTAAQSWEVICVDDGSEDDTHAALLEQRASEPRIRILKLSRNFGKEAAVAPSASPLSTRKWYALIESLANNCACWIS